MMILIWSCGPGLSCPGELNPVVAIIVISVSEREDDVVTCAEVGVAGYLLRTEPLAARRRRERLHEWYQQYGQGPPSCDGRVSPRT